MDVGSFEHRLVLFGPITRFETAGDSLFAIAENLGVFSAHSKSPFFVVAASSDSFKSSTMTGVSSFWFQLL
jgi:hypothetical protein